MERFFRRHHQQLFLFGTLIVFLTFVSKDALKDHWRGLADSVEATESVLSIRQDVGELWRVVRDIGKNVDSMHTEQLQAKSEILSHSVDPKNKAIFAALDEEIKKIPLADERSSELATDIGNARQKLRNVEDLVSRLPDSAEREKERQRLLDVVGAFQEECFLEQKSETFSKCWDRQAALKRDVDEFVKQTIAKGKDTRNWYGMLANVFGWLSIGLYTLGWSISFLAKKYGIPGGPEAG
jgi:hypothetical protein